MNYDDFIASKLRIPHPKGFTGAPRLSAHLFPFQGECVEWSFARGRSALFEACGLGKTAQQLEWAYRVCERTGGRALILAPLAVASQTVREGSKFGIPVKYARSGADKSEHGITIANYEMLQHFNPADFEAVVIDESSCLKAFSGIVKRRIVDAFKRTPFRLACTATPSPNDVLELGNHAEFLGVLSSHEMLARWFLPDTAHAGCYRLKGHAVTSFWDWVSSWARCASKPSDLGHSDEGYVLPELRRFTHVVDVDITIGRAAGQLYRDSNLSATNVHREKRITLEKRAAKIAELVQSEPGEPWLVWCDTDYEDDALRRLLPEARSIRGSDSIERKEAGLMGFVDGTHRVLITKPKIAGWGLNFQHCARVAYVGPSFSFEAYHQTTHRVHRFGQKRAVDVHVAMGSTEIPVWSTMLRKAEAHAAMQIEMQGAMRRAREATDDSAKKYNPRHTGSLPTWLHA